MLHCSVDNLTKGGHTMTEGKDKTILISGREITKQEIELVLETVKMFPNLSRSELVRTLCVNLNWTTPAGNLKYHSCRKLLGYLEDEGKMKLPAPRREKFKKKPIVITEATAPQEELNGTVNDIAPITLRKPKDKSERDLFNEYIERYHQLGYKRPFGARQRYFIISQKDKEQILGCLMFSAAAWALKARDAWIGWEEIDRKKRLNGILNNSRFLILPWVKVKNLASKALSLAAKQVPKDWQERYCYRPVLFETFVDTRYYQGTAYKAANWIYLGNTVGRGRMDRRKEYLSHPRMIYVYPLVEDFRAYLKGQRPDWEVG